MKFLFLFSALFFLTINKGYGKRVVCYFTNGSTHRSGDGRFSVQDIDPNLCTHIIYTFAKVQGTSLGTTDGNDLAMYPQIIALKQKNPYLKVMLAVGGWNHGSEPFTQMVATEQSRAEFVKNSYDLLKRYGFDGLDLDWEYPADRGSPPDDRHRFTQLVQELSAKYKPAGLLLSAATPASSGRYDGSYEPEACKYLDFINMMAYDFTGNWERVAGHNSPLTAQKQTVAHMLSKPDCTPDKLTLGMASYGRTHQLANPSANEIGSPNTGGSPISGPYTGESGILSYYEICQKFKEGWTRKWSDQYSVPYAYSGSNWVGYDDIQSISLKAQYVNEMNLGGAMFWALDLDDFRGNKCNEGKFPLINAAKNVINGKQSSTTTTPAIIPTTPAIIPTTPAIVPTTTATSIDQSITAVFYCQNSKEKQTYANISNNCQSYYDCLTASNGKQITVSRICPTTLIYVEDRKQCVKEKELINVNIKCSTKLRLPVESKSSANCWNPTAFVADSMCRFFTDCSTKRRYECPPNSLFEQTLKQCVPKQNVQCW